MRLLVAALCTVLFLVFLAERSVVAQGALRIVLVDLGSEELSRKVRAEATQAGFTVVPGADARLENWEVLEREHALALVTIRSEGQVEVYIARHGGEAPFSQSVARRPGEGDSFPLRVVEQLRARLIELEIVDESQFDSAPAPGTSTPASASPADPEPDRPAKPQLAPARATAPLWSEPDAHWNERLRDRERSRFWLRAGVAGTLPSGGIGATPQAALGLRYESSSGPGVGVHALLPFTNNDVLASEGKAEVNVNVFAASLDHSARVGEDWLVSGGAGGGLLVLAMKAEASSAFVGKDDRLLSGVFFASAGAGRWLGDWLRVRATLFGGASAPRPVLRFAEREVAAWGRWFAALALELDVGLLPGGGR